MPVAIIQFDVQSLVGEQLNEFDVDAPQRLQIVKFDPRKARVRNEFEVAEQNGALVHPLEARLSRRRYRADGRSGDLPDDREVLRVLQSDVEPGSRRSGRRRPVVAELDAPIRRGLVRGCA